MFKPHDVPPLPHDDEMSSIFAASSSIWEMQQKINPEISRKRIKRRLVKLGFDLSQYPDGTEHLLSSGARAGGLAAAQARVLMGRNKSDEQLKEELFVENCSVEAKHARRAMIRLINKLDLMPYKCKCGLEGQWEGENLVLQLDHKNGLSSDNRIENLRWLCPNCHSQTDTFCGRNHWKKREKLGLEPTGLRKLPAGGRTVATWKVDGT
jgi:hypothetical protein